MMSIKRKILVFYFRGMFFKFDIGLPATRAIMSGVEVNEDTRGTVLRCHALNFLLKIMRLYDHLVKKKKIKRKTVRYTKR